MTKAVIDDANRHRVVDHLAFLVLDPVGIDQQNNPFRHHFITFEAQQRATFIQEARNKLIERGENLTVPTRDALGNATTRALTDDELINDSRFRITANPDGRGNQSMSVGEFVRFSTARKVVLERSRVFNNAAAGVNNEDPSQELQTALRSGGAGGLDVLMGGSLWGALKSFVSNFVMGLPIVGKLIRQATIWIASKMPSGGESVTWERAGQRAESVILAERISRNVGTNVANQNDLNAMVRDIWERRVTAQRPTHNVLLTPEFHIPVPLQGAYGEIYGASSNVLPASRPPGTNVGGGASGAPPSAPQVSPPVTPQQVGALLGNMGGISGGAHFGSAFTPSPQSTGPRPPAGTTPGSGTPGG